MPTYVYACKCGYRFEADYPMPGPVRVRCQSRKCGRLARKVPSGGNFVLKGEGWPGKDIKEGKAGR